MKKLLVMVLSAALMFCLVACDTSESSTSTASKEGSSSTEVKVGVSLYDLSNEYFQYMQEGIEQAAEENNVKIVSVHDQKSDESELLTGCENLLNQGIDALIVSPCKPEIMSTIVESAKEKNVPVIILDIGDGGSDKDVIVVSDMYGGGAIAGKYALDLLSDKSITSGEFAVIKCEESAVYAIQRGEGFKDIMEDAGFKCATEITANSDQTEGYNAMQDILTSYPDVKAVFAENDDMALGAASAIDEAGKTGDILILGFDGNESAIEAIKDGSMSGTIAQQPIEIGTLGIELAIKRINGEELTYDNDSTKEIYAEVYLIDKTGEKNTKYTVD